MKILLRTFLIAYLLVVVLLAFLQRTLMYHPARADSLPVVQFPDVTDHYPAAADVHIDCDDGVKLGAWLLKADNGDAEQDRPLVLFFHGNAGNRSHRSGWYELLAECAVDVLAIDYHGYGDSAGKPSQAALYNDAEATWKYATQTLKYRPADIFVMGNSIGGGPAVHLASQQSLAEQPPAGLIIVATFASMVDVASAHYPWLPVRAILVDRYPTGDKIRNVTCPVLQFHGNRDRVVEQRFGRQLFSVTPVESASGIPKRWVHLANIGHNDLLSGSGELIQRQIVEFTRQTCPD